MFWPVPVSSDVASTACYILQSKEGKARKVAQEKNEKRIAAFEKKTRERLGLAKAREAAVTAEKDKDINGLAVAKGRLDRISGEIERIVGAFRFKAAVKARKELSAIERRFDDLKTRCLLELLPPKVRRIIGKA